MAKWTARIGGVVKRVVTAVKSAVGGRRAAPASATVAPKATTPTKAAGASPRKPKTAKVVIRSKKATKAKQALANAPKLTGRRTGPHNKKSLKNLSAKQRAAVTKKRNKDRDDKRTRRKDASKAAVAQRKNTAGAEPKAKEKASTRIVNKLSKIVGAVKSLGKRRTRK